MAYSLPSIAAYLYKSTTKRLQVIFGPYLPEAQPKDFYEMEIASASIMRGFMSVPCDVYFTMEAKVSRFLDCSLKLYDVPKEKRAAITAAAWRWTFTQWLWASSKRPSNRRKRALRP